MIKSLFGDCDRDSHGKIVNTNPLWTKKKSVADMEDSIRDIEKKEEMGMVTDLKAKLLQKQKKLKLQTTIKQVKASDPRGKIKGRELDKVRTVVDSFIEEVKNRNTTHDDDKRSAESGKSMVSPSLQGDMSKRPCIKLKTDDEIAFAKSCNMRIDENNMVSRDDMTRGIWLGEPILDIRPDHNRLKRDVPFGHISKSSQVQVGNLPDDMGNKKKELAQTV